MHRPADCCATTLQQDTSIVLIFNLIFIIINFNYFITRISCNKPACYGNLAHTDWLLASLFKFTCVYRLGAFFTFFTFQPSIFCAYVNSLKGLRSLWNKLYSDLLGRWSEYGLLSIPGVHCEHSTRQVRFAFCRCVLALRPHQTWNGSWVLFQVNW